MRRCCDGTSPIRACWSIWAPAPAGCWSPLPGYGFRCLAVDLSAAHAGSHRPKADAEQLPIDRLRANFVELGCLRDASADYCICMFSTLGMVRGHENRLQVLRHVARILKPGGKFVMHVHNRWHNLRQPEGRRWLLANFFRWFARGDTEPGDKFFEYRGVPSMFLHVYTRSELTSSLRSAGFQIEELISLNTGPPARAALALAAGTVAGQRLDCRLPHGFSEPFGISRWKTLARRASEGVPSATPLLAQSGSYFRGAFEIVQHQSPVRLALGPCEA